MAKPPITSHDWHYQEWFKTRKAWHREDGPALIQVFESFGRTTMDQSWFINGQFVAEVQLALSLDPQPVVRYA